MGLKLSFPEMKSLWTEKAEGIREMVKSGAPVWGVQFEMVVTRPSKEMEEAAG